MGDPGAAGRDGDDPRALRRGPAASIRSAAATSWRRVRARCCTGWASRTPQIDGDVGALSGGWKMRVAMAKVLLGKPDVLLMDEPTNHLDIESILWLERFIKDTSSAVLMTCHDRDFMNRVVDRVVEIDGGELISYSGDYDFYASERVLRETQREAAYARQQAMLAKEQRFIERFAAHAAKAAQVQSRVKKLEKIETSSCRAGARSSASTSAHRRARGDDVAVLDVGVQALRRSRDLRRPRPHHPPRRALVRHGPERGGEDDAAQDGRRARSSPDAGTVRLGASLAHGVLRAAVARSARSATGRSSSRCSTIFRSRPRARCARCSARSSFRATTSTSRSGRCRAARNRAS